MDNQVTPAGPPDWPDADVDMLKKLVALGLSASQCARGLGRTRSATISKAARLGLNFQGSNAAHMIERRARERRAGRFVHQPVRPDQPGPLKVMIRPALGRSRTLVTIGPHRCHFPKGETGGADQLLCGRRLPPGDVGPYCEECSGWAYSAGFTPKRKRQT